MHYDNKRVLSINQRGTGEGIRDEGGGGGTGGGGGARGSGGGGGECTGRKEEAPSKHK
jgi:hypothetical protein